jgi:hypothetical protein
VEPRARKTKQSKNKSINLKETILGKNSKRGMVKGEDDGGYD